MEGCLQSSLDLRPGYSKYQPSTYQTHVFSNYFCSVGLPLTSFRRNTQEKKPVTNSRDTQELLPDAGQEMMRIFHTHPARTSLLQDFAFYEVCIQYHNSRLFRTFMRGCSFKPCKRHKRLEMWVLPHLLSFPPPNFMATPSPITIHHSTPTISHR